METCKRCGYEWRLRTDADPKACPNCRSRSWNIPAGRKGKYCPECPHCNAPEPIPSRRPKTEAQTTLDRFNTLTVPDEPEPGPKTTKCPKCGHEWQTRTDTPKKCPKCQARLDADIKTSAPRAARALAALGPLSEETPAPDDSLAVCDWGGTILGWTTGNKITRSDKSEHYPVFDGPTFDGEYFLVGWIRTDAPFERRS